MINLVLNCWNPDALTQVHVIFMYPSFFLGWHDILGIVLHCIWLWAIMDVTQL